MSEINEIIKLPDEIILNKIYKIRGQKVMLDRDLAELYGIKTKVLKQAVRRNIKRFPKDFMFEMSKLELEYWRSQFVTSNMEMDEGGEKMGLRYAPFCFTEQGVAMLSSVLNSERAINVNIQIIRIFTRMRKLILNQKEILLKLEKLEKSSLKNKEDIKLIFSYLKKLVTCEDNQKRNQIGFKRD